MELLKPLISSIFSVKVRITNILDFLGHVIFVTADYFYHYNTNSAKEGIDNTYTYGNNCIPTKFYLQN